MMALRMPSERFQFTLPCRERLGGDFERGCVDSFNSRSRVGSDDQSHRALRLRGVSIHAPV